MKNPQHKPYLYAMLAGFGAISLSVLLFFFIYRLQGIGEVLDHILNILKPFIYGSVVAYLLRPACNMYSRWLSNVMPAKGKRLVDPLAITLSMITGLLVIYALIIMIAPQLYQSILSLEIVDGEDRLVVDTPSGCGSFFYLAFRTLNSVAPLALLSFIFPPPPP